MRRFTRLYLDLDSTNSTNEKVAIMERYFREAPAPDAAWAAALLLGERPKGGASTRTLTRLAIRASGVPEWLFGECYAAVGDLSETVARLVPGEGEAVDEPLHVTMRERVLPLAGSGEADREHVILDAWRVFGADERFIFHKLARGGFRVGVQKRLVARALAQVAGVEVSEMMLRLSGPMRPDAEWLESLLAGGDTRAAAAYPFFLAHQLDAPPESLGERGQWQAEWKWDGVRAQLVRRQQVLLWSRGEEPLTDQFPELATAARALPEGTVLDGEVLMWRGERPLPFSHLQRRLGRKVAPSVQGSLFDRDEAVFLAFDVLEAGGQDVRSRPLSERRDLLEQLLSAPAVQKGGTLRRSPLLAEPGWAGLAEARAGSRGRGVEGLVLKHLDSAYGVGRSKGEPGGGWWKWKIDPYSVDGVLVYAQPGSGRRASLLTDYTFAVWEGEGDGRRLTPFAKAYSGLDRDEIESLDAWIRRHTVRKNGPVRQVEPVRVFEIHFEGIAESDRHRSGVAVRFPRIARERLDKRAADADTLESLRSLIRTPP